MCIRTECFSFHFAGHFHHHHHTCIVFELLSMNLYELLKSTQFVGLPLKLVGKFSSQVVTTLSHLLSHGRGTSTILHCDLKLENILLLTPNRSRIKVIDFGSACLHDEKTFTYIQSRFYRAPEVILGGNYNAAIE